MITTDVKINTIPEALEDLKQGKVIIVVDDENRENEGDFIAAASTMTAETINFITQYGRGLVCVPLTYERAEKLDLNFMVEKNTDPKKTAFTVSVDLLGHGVTTGISASDRAKTIQALADENMLPKDFARPGHIFPLIAKKGGVLKRDGHTEAAVDLLNLAGLPSTGVLIEIMNEDGSMARLPELAKVAEKFNLKIITIEDLIAYRLKNDTLIEKIDDSLLETHYGKLRLVSYKDKTNDQIHFALIKGVFNEGETVPVRVQALNTYTDLFKNLALGEENTLSKTMQQINKEGKGAAIFINNPNKDKIIENHLSEIKDYISGKNNKLFINSDQRNLGIGAQIIKNLGIKKINILSSTPGKTITLNSGYGIEIIKETLL
ncbi:3,4-dihydroxy-2-butanone-4-phosphate synthase [Apibacter adventoris]|uniref:3,4-dihydroxy-2-butanone-4-phosphate synthase n=1 Tax=Apibacter adventoris TaxID=1679466 RepID=UPI000CF738F2|nr:3,4-dihydroxy-2-butanone-4-phosphate synthase [Apibacter adventoris]PQL96004.1 3,4-dihydroxy-2-butanone-4-phosphate synthase [Apibacter adventoris]